MNPVLAWWLDYWRGLAEWRPRSPLLRLHIQTLRLKPYRGAARRRPWLAYDRDSAR